MHILLHFLVLSGIGWHGCCILNVSKLRVLRMHKHRRLTWLWVTEEVFIWKMHVHCLISCLRTVNWAFVAFNPTRLFAWACHVRIIVSTCLEIKIVLLFVHCFALFTVDQVTPVQYLLLNIINSLWLSLLELPWVLLSLLHRRHCRLLDTTFLCNEAVLNYLVNVFSLTQCCLVI